MLVTTGSSQAQMVPACPTLRRLLARVLGKEYHDDTERDISCRLREGITTRPFQHLTVAASLRLRPAQATSGDGDEHLDALPRTLLGILVLLDQIGQYTIKNHTTLQIYPSLVSLYRHLRLDSPVRLGRHENPTSSPSAPQTLPSNRSTSSHSHTAPSAPTTQSRPL